jgi:1-acyl-sn-glycerol-3-phosphate acyltransferase
MLRSILASVAGWIVSIVVWLFLILAKILLLGFLPDRTIVACIRFWGRSMMRLSGVTLLEQNASTLAGRKPRVVVVNHQSSFDLIWGASIIPEGALAVGKKELLWIPFFNLLWWAVGFKFLNRQNQKKAHATMRLLARIVQEEKRSLFIAPEGTRSPSKDMGGFKMGAFHVALETGASVYPVVASGVFEIWPRTAWFPRSGTIIIKYLPPVSTQEWTVENLRTHVKDLHEQMERAFEELEVIRLQKK